MVSAPELSSSRVPRRAIKTAGGRFLPQRALPSSAGKTLRVKPIPQQMPSAWPYRHHGESTTGVQAPGLEPQEDSMHAERRLQSRPFNKHRSAGQRARFQSSAARVVGMILWPSMQIPLSVSTESQSCLRPMSGRESSPSPSSCADSSQNTR